MERKKVLWYAIFAFVALAVVGFNLYSEPYVLSNHEMSELIGMVPCQVRTTEPDPDCPNNSCYQDGIYWVQRQAWNKKTSCSSTTSNYRCYVVDSNALICEWGWYRNPGTNCSAKAEIS